MTASSGGMVTSRKFAEIKCTSDKAQCLIKLQSNSTLCRNKLCLLSTWNCLRLIRVTTEFRHYKRDTKTEHSRQSCAMSTVVYTQSVPGSTWCKGSVVFSTKARQQRYSMLYRFVMNILQSTIQHVLLLISLRFFNPTFFLNLYIYTDMLAGQVIYKIWYSRPWQLLVL
jgi:hypothetical protein